MVLGYEKKPRGYHCRPLKRCLDVLNRPICDACIPSTAGTYSDAAQRPENRSGVLFNLQGKLLTLHFGQTELKNRTAKTRGPLAHSGSLLRLHNRFFANRAGTNWPTARIVLQGQTRWPTRVCRELSLRGSQISHLESQRF